MHSPDAEERFFHVIGLGNPGKQYVGTRHNTGFRVLDTLAVILGAGPEEQDGSFRLAKAEYGKFRVMLCKPWTYMNRSGDVIAALGGPGALEASRMVVVLDDLALPLGTLRLRLRGSSGGQRGLASIIEAMGTFDFPRLRCGIGPLSQGVDAADFVLAGFDPDESSVAESMTGRAAEAIETVLKEGFDTAMNRWNTPASSDAAAAPPADAGEYPAKTPETEDAF